MNETNDQQRSEQSKASSRGDGDEPDYFRVEREQLAAIHDAAALFAQLLRKAHNGNIKPSSQIWGEVREMVERLDGLKK